MLNGDWIIQEERTKSTKHKSDDFLPPGLHVQIKLLGPSRAAIEENRTDELGGEIVLLPPFPDIICSTAIGAQICSNKAVRNPAKQASFDAIFSFSTWNRQDADDAEGSLFLEMGARVGSHFVLVTIPGTGLEWQLWIQSRDQLLNAYLLKDSSDKVGEEAPQIWRRLRKPM